jgi:hypothetical protein
LRSAAAGNFFFQPLDLHVEPTDLLVELGLERLAFVSIATAAVAEQRFDAVYSGLRWLGIRPILTRRASEGSAPEPSLARFEVAHG